MAHLLECRHLNPEVPGSNPTLVNDSLLHSEQYINVPSLFPLWFIRLIDKLVVHVPSH